MTPALGPIKMAQQRSAGCFTAVHTRTDYVRTGSGFLQEACPMLHTFDDYDITQFLDVVASFGDSRYGFVVTPIRII